MKCFIRFLFVSLLALHSCHSKYDSLNERIEHLEQTTLITLQQSILVLEAEYSNIILMIEELQAINEQRTRELEYELNQIQESLNSNKSYIEYILDGYYSETDIDLVVETILHEIEMIKAELYEIFQEIQSWQDSDEMPLIVIPQVYEPSDDLVDVGYSSPIGRNNVMRANWSAAKKYTYYEFLTHYYDKYLGKTDGYSVYKRSLGTDSSKSGYELFEYDFQPSNYNKVVMLSAGMNACETGAIWGLATFVKALMTSEEEGFKFLRENVRFKILPFICPSSFDQTPLSYLNSNGVRINKNFDWNRGWYDVDDLTKGEYPDSEAESRILKTWINENAWKVDLYMDCHQDPDKNTNQVNDLAVVICSDTQTRLKLERCFPSLIEFYRTKGYIESDVTPDMHSWVEPGYSYPKTRYAKDVCGIPSIMIEQYCSSTMFGSDGNTINDIYGIKNYVAMVRLYIFAILANNE